jgi:hypothetical protein
MGDTINAPALALIRRLDGNIGEDLLGGDKWLSSEALFNRSQNIVLEKRTFSRRL